MEKKLSTILKGILIIGLSIFLISPVMAQREIPRERGEFYITKDHISKINEIVKPLIDQFGKQLNGDETYQAYLADLKVLNSTKSVEEKKTLTERLNEKYSGYFQKVWAAAGVDEKTYQLRIRSIFPPNIAELIQFGSFLVFTVQAAAVPSQPPAEPPPPDKCMDVCTIAAGEITGESGLIAAGGGSYGYCFLRTNAWSFLAGGGFLLGYLRNGITIPGTFPNDSRKLRVRKYYQVRQEASTFAALGGGYAETRAKTFKTSEYMLVWSPVIFGASSFLLKTMSENYLLEKKDVAVSRFQTTAQTFSAFISGNWCFSEFSGIIWTICEER